MRTIFFLTYALSLVYTGLSYQRLLTENIEWVASVNLTKWYSPLDLCILHNSSKVDIDEIINDCIQSTKLEMEGRLKQPPRCTVGNAWRGPAKSPFCSAEDIPYSDRVHFRQAIRGFDDPSKTPLKDFFTSLAKRKGSIILIGDSVQQQFMGAMACELEREGVWPDSANFWNTDETKLVSVSTNENPNLPAVPIKFSAIYHFVNGRYDRIANASMHALKKSVTDFVDKYDCVVVVMNMGLHYVSSPMAHFSRVDYVAQMTAAFLYLDEVVKQSRAAGKEVIVLWRETTAQHFATPNGYWPGQKFASTMKVGCFPIEDPSAAGDWRNTDIRTIIQSHGLGSSIRVVPFYDLSVPLWSQHVNGNLRDCTHICWSPMLYQSYFRFLADAIV